MHLKFIFTILVLFMMGRAAFAAEGLQSAPMIFDVRINLPLEPDEETFHDFYINSGPEAGFKRGMFVTVVRPVPVHDPVQNKQQATLNINVARLQVIHVEHGITVARLFSEFTDEERPTLEYESVMIGDRIDVSSNTMDAPNAKKKARPSAPAKRSTTRLEKIADRVEETARADIPAAPPASGQPVAPSAPASGPASNPASGPVQIPVPAPTGSGPTRSTSAENRIPLLAVESR